MTTATKTTTARKTAAKAETTPENETPADETVTQHATLAAALAAFQAEVPTVRKGNTADVKSNNGGRSYTYDYADLSDVTEKALPLLGKHGLSFSSKPTIQDGAFVLAYVLRHDSGEVDEGTYPLPNANTPAQQMGSAITYARRYVLCAVTGIAPGGDDDDAGAIQQHQYAAPVTQQRQQAAARPAQQREAQDAQRPPATNGPPEAEVLAAANATTTRDELADVWQRARAAGASASLLDAVAKIGQERAAAEAAAAQDAAAEPQDADAPSDDAEAAEAAAVAAHEAELRDGRDVSDATMTSRQYAQAEGVTA